VKEIQEAIICGEDTTTINRSQLITTNNSWIKSTQGRIYKIIIASQVMVVTMVTPPAIIE